MIEGREVPTFYLIKINELRNPTFASSCCYATMHGAYEYYVCQDGAVLGQYGLQKFNAALPQKEFIMSPTLIDLSAAAVAGIALTGAVLGFTFPRAHMAPAGEPGFGIEAALDNDVPVRTANTTRFGGSRNEEKADPAWASFPRAF